MKTLSSGKRSGIFNYQYSCLSFSEIQISCSTKDIEERSHFLTTWKKRIQKEQRSSLTGLTVSMLLEGGKKNKESQAFVLSVTLPSLWRHSAFASQLLKQSGHGKQKEERGASYYP